MWRCCPYRDGRAPSACFARDLFTAIRRSDDLAAAAAECTMTSKTVRKGTSKTRIRTLRSRSRVRSLPPASRSQVSSWADPRRRGRGPRSTSQPTGRSPEPSRCRSRPSRATIASARKCEFMTEGHIQGEAVHAIACRRCLQQTAHRPLPAQSNCQSALLVGMPFRRLGPLCPDSRQSGADVIDPEPTKCRCATPLLQICRTQ